MNYTKRPNWRLIVLSLLTTAAFTVRADQATAPAKEDKTSTGIITSIDPKEHRLGVKSVFVTRHFNLGESCEITTPTGSTAEIEQLRPGQKVQVSYQSVGGILVANRIKQLSMSCEGTVKEMSAVSRKMTVRLRGTDKTFLIPDGCAISVPDKKSATLADVQPGHRVSVIYEAPSGTATARQIKNLSTTVIATLTAVDSSAGIIKAKYESGTGTFYRSDTCIIVTDGKPDGDLSDLRSGDKVALSYEEVDGVKVLNRIANAGPKAEPGSSR